jgi:prepilin-type N-terminal cleavage/methylation domain-containing protein
LETGGGQAYVASGMKTAATNSKLAGLTLIELLVVVVVIAIVAVMLTPRSRIHEKAYTVVCMSHQKQIGLGLIMFQTDNNGEFPWQVAGTNGGSLESVSQGQVSPHFQVLSKYIPNLTNLLLCPTDKNRKPADNVSQLRDENVSYFLNLDAGTNTPINTSILGGDRHLEADNKPVHPGLFICTSNMVLSWSSELHGKMRNGPHGGLLFGDGHVQFTTSKDLNDFIQSQPAATNRFAVP